MLRVPSIPRPEVPIGKGEEDNVEIRKVGTPRKFEFKPKDHVELMTNRAMVELGRSAKIRRRSLVRAHRTTARSSSSPSRASRSTCSCRAATSS